MKKLRLFVTNNCHNNCKKCCNKQFNIDEIPIIGNDYQNYNEISITGGEPMLNSDKLKKLLFDIKLQSNYFNTDITIYVYTSLLDFDKYAHVIRYIDGLTYTPHSYDDVLSFVKEKDVLEACAKRCNLSLRINIFPEVKQHFIDKNIDLSNWKVKYMEWINNCPYPEDEDFKRLKTLY